MLAEHYKLTDDVTELSLAVTLAEQAVSAAWPENPDLSSMQFKLSIIRGMKYEQSMDPEDLNRAVELAERVVTNTPATHPDRAPRLNNLGIRLGRKFEMTDDMEDINRAIQLSSAAVDATPTDDASRTMRLNNLSHLLDMRFSRTKNAEDINLAIKNAQAAMDATPDGPHRATIQNTLGTLHRSRYEKLGKTEDAYLAVKLTKCAVNATPHGHPRRSLRLHNLKSLLILPLSIPEEIEGLNQCIEVAEIAVEVASMIDLDKPSAMEALGKMFMIRFERLGMLEDLSKAIQVTEEVLETMTSFEESRMIDLLSTLGCYLGTRFQGTGKVEDLNRAIEVTEIAMEISSPGTSAWLCSLHNLSNWLGLRFKATGSASDLDRAIEMADISVQAGNDDPEAPSSLITLGIWLAKRSQLTGKMEDLQRAVEVSELAVNTAPLDYHERGKLLVNLGNRLGRRYEETGDLKDLNRAIELISMSVDLFAPEHPTTADALSNLGLYLSTRFERTGSMEDINEAVRVADLALLPTPPDHPQRPERLATVGKTRGMRFERSRASEDITRAISALEAAVHATSPENPNAAHIFNYLGLCHHMHFELSGDEKSLHKSIEIASLALNSKSLDYMDQATLMFNLGLWIGRRYEITENEDDLDLAIETIEKALKVASEYQADQASNWNSLGLLLTMRFERTGGTDDRVRAESSFRTGWDCPHSPPVIRIHIAENLAVHLGKQDKWEESKKFLEEAVKLLPALSPRSIQTTDRHHMLSRFFGLASMAAAATLNAGTKPPSTSDVCDAIRMLEQGRGIATGLILDIQTDVSELEEKCPKLAAEFISARDELGEPDHSAWELRPNSSISWRESREKRHREAEDRFTAVVLEIRTHDGFKDFLRPPTNDQLRAAAGSDLIVVINVSYYRCDAFIVSHQISTVVELPELRIEDIQEKAELLKGGDESEAWEILEWLWTVAACSIMHAMKIEGPPTDGNWPHVRWVLTGQLSQLPLHAAGRHLASSNETVLDRVISSYSLSIRAVAYGRRSVMAEPRGSDNALLISMPTTVGNADLRFAQEEVDMLEKMCASLRLNPVRSCRRNEDIQKLLPTCKVFHFAGHGYSDPAEPSQSYLMLEDWETHPLTVAELREYNLQDNPPFLAYLSACHTGANDVVRFSDEMINLISACQSAGFRHVVGTLWEVSDKHCVDVAKVLYQTLAEEGMTDKAVCLGLHQALRALRASDARSWSSGRKGFLVSKKTEERKFPMIHWIPYVHFGA